MTSPLVVSAVVVDCQAPTMVAVFWQALLGGTIRSYPDLHVEALRAPGINIDFVACPDAKGTKNRWHLDLAADDASAAVAMVEALGGQRAVDLSESDRFVVMRDPEGNEFCVLFDTPATGPWALPSAAQP